jgi:ABC-2 type transport system ATP-binding protein
MIEVTGLTKSFGATMAVQNLSFSVREGRVTGFLGPNGAGKSTTMRCMLQLDRADAGTCAFNGRRYQDLKRPLREVGSLLDAKYVHPTRTARNHLRAMAASNGIATKRVDEVLETVGLTEVAKRRVGGFSLGMSQRLGLAGALLGDPHTMLFDEPANGLDPEGIQWIRQFMKHLASQGRTVLVSSHLLAEMSLTADDLVVIGRGQLIAQGSVADFVSRTAGSWVSVRSPEVARLAALLSAEGAKVETAADRSLTVHGAEAAAIGELAARNGIVLHELAPRQGSLEEAFLEATRETQEFRTGMPLEATPAPAPVSSWSPPGSALPPPPGGGR